MDKRQILFMFFLVTISGFLGGLVSEKIFSSSIVLAEKVETAEIISAEGFHLVDKSGGLRGAFIIGTDGNPKIHLLDEIGLFRMTLSLDDEGTP